MNDYLFCGDEWEHEPHEWSNFGTYDCPGWESHNISVASDATEA
jgi:hypothetical protein